MPFQPQPFAISVVSAPGGPTIPPSLLLSAGGPPPANPTPTTPANVSAGAVVSLGAASMSTGTSPQLSPLQQWVAVGQVTGMMSGIGFVNPSTNLTITYNGPNNPLVLQPYVLGSAALDLWALNVQVPQGSTNGWTTVWPITFLTPDGTGYWGVEAAASASGYPTLIVTENVNSAATWQFLQLSAVPPV